MKTGLANTVFILLIIVISGCMKSTPVCNDEDSDHSFPRISFDFAEQNYWDGLPEVLSDGRRLPTRFVISDTYRSPRLDDPPYKIKVEFRLIPSGIVCVDGVNFVVDRPFYICTTELSLFQCALLLGSLDSDSYHEYLSNLTDRYNKQLDITVEDNVLNSDFSSYISNGELPALGFDYQYCMEVLSSASENYAVPVRLPSLAEWHFSLKAGADTKYWWGNEVDSKHAVSGDSSGRYLKLLQPVSQGYENPWGLHHMIGNASEVVMPTQSEWRKLRRHFVVDKYSNALKIIGPQLLLNVGGNVLNKKTFCFLYASDLKRQISTRTQTIQNVSGNWLYCVGMRPVIDIPYDYTID